MSCHYYSKRRFRRLGRSIDNNPNLDEQNVSSKHMRTRDSSSKITDLVLELSLPPAQKESPSKDSSGTFPLLNTA